uniref:ATP synthase F0 subunit 8 n=1 Tax=Dexia tenuiforceps TaxID=3025369 RepID=UPI0023AB3336|nr:ATP synthase F0 subunit 8 [Dexia tenuiforceps]WCL18800.1 ATP synthase F0 subunit 8 [Dexia tenuiforceps]
MPQMSPINWLSLFIVFSLTFMMFNMMNYYIYNPLLPKFNSIGSKNKTPLNWKW